MAKQKLDSREYKVMLRASRFNGDESELLTAAGELWSELRRVIKESVFDTDGDLDTIEPGKRRRIRFYDTTSCRLRRNDYVFRERVEVISGEREVTLKFRHPKSSLVQDRDMDAKDGAKDVKSKFEEDVKPDQPLFSFSTRQRISEDKNLNKMDDPGRLYPGLRKKLDAYNPDELIHQVGPRVFRERVITGASFQITEGDDPKVAKCALVVWYTEPGDLKVPEVAEFSFKYDKKLNSKKPKALCENVLQLLSTQLTDWVDPKSKTKTAYVYSLAEPPCPEELQTSRHG